MTMDDRLAKVPGYTTFFGVDELYGHAERVVDRNPGLCRRTIVGASKDNEPIPMISVGSGKTSILLFASPHPNEPIGAMMAYFLLEELIRDPSLREGRTWHIVPCIDPDGTRSNEGWFAGPFTLANYARHFYRPLGTDQAEWTFPFQYKTFKFDRPIPETRALMKAIDISRPAVMYALHNSGFGGAYYYISRPLEAAYPAMHRLPKERGLPLSLGEPESPFCVELYPAVYRTTSVSDAYDYYEKFGKGDPAGFMFGGGSSRDYADTVSSPFTLITEVPYFKAAAVGDTTRIGRKRGDVVLEGLDGTAELLTFAQGIVEATLPKLGAGGKFRDASAGFIPLLLKQQDGERAWARSPEIMGQEATSAQLAHALYVGPFYTTLIIAMYRRALKAQLDQTPDPGLEGAYAQLDARIEATMAGIQEGLACTSMPIRDLVQIQYGALLAVLEGLGL
ncbi:MAG TPA: M14 family zinc carboxypeptidase [Spirochaetia bacterium]|nr:M14 family zinc carboxypeptidase [Spirochaetia bacterium]